MHGTIQAVDEMEAFLGRAKALRFHDKICAAFERADKLKIAFVGETIIDEYRYVLPLAKPSKEFIVASVESREPEMFAGGVVAAALHGDWREFRLVTQPGDAESAIIKTRFVDADFTRKLFEVYSAKEVGISGQQRERMHCELIDATRAADVVIVFDFGHGMMGAQERHIVGTAKFLAVNAQTNAGNYGFNPVTKYAGADYVCIDEPEARLATGCQTEKIEDVAVLVMAETACGHLAVTHGRHGSLVRNAASKCAHIPAFATNGLDTMGAGDAFLAVTAPLVAAGLELEAAAFVGNVAGAIKVSIVGHRRHVTRPEIMAKIAELLS